MFTRSQTRPRHAQKRRRTALGGMLRLQTALVAVCLSAGILPAATAPVAAADPLDIPPAVDPGTPVFKGSANPVPDAPVAFDPTKNMLGSIYDADVAAGGDSFWLDRVLERPFKDTSAGERTLLTRGRALYMYTHNPSVLGFVGQGTGANGGGGYAYRQPPTTGTVALYTIGISGATLAETTAQRLQYPSYFTSLYTGGGLSVAGAEVHHLQRHRGHRPDASRTPGPRRRRGRSPPSRRSPRPPPPTARS